MNADAPIIKLDNLQKHYGSVRALDGISFTVNAGEVFGLLGHNGAGKTTTIRLLSGRTRPTGGTASVAGYDIVAGRAGFKPLINLVFEEQNLYERLTGRDNLEVFADLYREPRQRVDELLELVRLTDSAKRRVKTYSTGMKQRLLIARALVNRPRLLFLDEPSRGLDPASARDLRDLVQRLSAGGTTIFLTTHYMEEADELCDRVAFLSAGKVVALDSPRELKLRYGRRIAHVLLDDRREVTLSLEQEEDRRQLAALVEAGRVITVHSQEGSLEDVFIALAGAPVGHHQ